MQTSSDNTTFLEKENKNKYENKDSLVLRLRRNISDKTMTTMLYYKEKKKDENEKQKSTRFLITINVFGSAGPIRFVVNEEDNAAEVIEAALRIYGRQGRLPILGSDINTFFLYPVNAGFDALEPSEEIGSRGVRNFVLCKKQSNTHMTETRSSIVHGKGSGWRKWLQKSLSMKFPSH